MNACLSLCPYEKVLGKNKITTQTSKIFLHLQADRWQLYMTTKPEPALRLYMQ